MAEQQHPITPPPELVQQWDTEGRHQDYCTVTEYIAHRAAQWGADQELEACCELMDRDFMAGPSDLRAARRPKPPRLKERALAVIENSEICDHLSPEHAAILRRALEQLDASGNLLPHYQPLQETND
jgi:hypothetical protein